MEICRIKLGIVTLIKQRARSNSGYSKIFGPRNKLLPIKVFNEITSKLSVQIAKHAQMKKQLQIESILRDFRVGSSIEQSADLRVIQNLNFHNPTFLESGLIHLLRGIL